MIAARGIVVISVATQPLLSIFSINIIGPFFISSCKSNVSSIVIPFFPEYSLHSTEGYSIFLKETMAARIFATSTAANPIRNFGLLIDMLLPLFLTVIIKERQIFFH
jgi:hypothetical protein